MQTGGCMEATANGGVSGSFTSGSEEWVYHEFTCAAVTSSETFQFTVTKGFTDRARFVVIGGGGGGGWDGQGTYGIRGGGGGGAAVINRTGQLFQGTYSIQVGAGGEPADADNANPALRTFNGGDGDYSEILGGPYTGTDRLKSLGGEGGFGDSSVPATYGDGGDSGTGFLGGQYNANGSGGGAGATSNGGVAFFNGSDNQGGAGGTGKTISLGYTSPTFGTSTISVGGGGGGIGYDPGVGTDGGGQSAGAFSTADDGGRHTGGGGGGGEDFAATPPAGIGTTGGDGIVIIYYPTGSCQQFQPVEAINLRTGSEACFLTSSEQGYFYHDENNDGVMGVGDYLYYDSKSSLPLPNGTRVTNAGTSFFVTGTEGRITSESIECLEVYNIISNNTGSGLSGSYDVNFDMGTENSLMMWMKGTTQDAEIVELTNNENFKFQGDVAFFPTRYRVRGNLYDGTTNYLTNPTNLYSQSLWTMHTVTWNQSSGDIKKYDNITLNGTGSYTSSLNLNDAQLKILEDPIQSPLVTNIGEVRIYGKELSLSEITTIYNDTKGRYGL